MVKLKKTFYFYLVQFPPQNFLPKNFPKFYLISTKFCHILLSFTLSVLSFTKYPTSGAGPCEGEGDSMAF